MGSTRDYARHAEPCASCGQSTLVGTPLFFDRRVIDEVAGGRAYLCADCDGLVRKARRIKRLSDDEARQMIENGTMEGFVYRGLGDFTAFTGGG